MNRPLLRALGAGLLGLISLSGAQAALIYSLANDGTTLVRFDSATPGAVTTVGPISGATTLLHGMDFRPADGQLYGYSDATDGIYRVNLATGVTTFVATNNIPTTTALLGIDFNPVPDRLRIVDVARENRRIVPDTGVNVAPAPDGTLTYAAADPNAAATPAIIDAAYTNSDRIAATGTTLYYIDYLLDILVSTANPNGGILNTIGALGVDTDEFTGFDILTGTSGANVAFASLTVGGSASLFTINLATGAATAIGGIGARELYGLAVVPGFLPAPGSLSLALGAALVLGWRQRRRTLDASA